jgi:hypothetical protein
MINVTKPYVEASDHVYRFSKYIYIFTNKDNERFFEKYFLKRECHLSLWRNLNFAKCTNLSWYVCSSITSCFLHFFMRWQLLCIFLMNDSFFAFFQYPSRVLFDVAEQSDPAHGPVPGPDVALEVDGADVVEVGASRLPVDGTLV